MQYCFERILQEFNTMFQTRAPQNIRHKRLKAGLLNFENRNYRERHIFYSCPVKKTEETLQEDETFYVCQSGVELFRKSNRIKKYVLQKIEKYC